MSATKRLRELAEKISNPADLATTHYAELSSAERAAYDEQLRYREAVRVLRSDVRDAEHEVSDLIASGVSPIVARKQLKGRGFFVPDTGEWVPWLQATVDQHRLRSEYLRKQAGGYLRTAEMHDQAIDDIVAAGVTTLAELEERAA